ncbi:hypothetical protein E2C01_011140 [Portunus trituberculatus]|uniref:Uncharacterized protein n=1 Tax=Portunus trituberculatus TaxID=210409 RepID=A0A5B7DAB7_PORTR|nr:hypothetical protein [Portunus trituberculatus]
MGMLLVLSDFFLSGEVDKANHRPLRPVEVNVNKQPTAKMSSSSDDAEAVVALILVYWKSQQKRKYLWICAWLSRRERSVYHTLN